MTSSSHTMTNWQFKEKEAVDWLDAHVPGTVHTDLYKNGQIPHPYEERNEIDLQWIDKKDWIYRSELTVTSDMLKEEHLDLVFDGLDTFTTVFVNQTQVLKADNMYRQWKTNIKEVVHEGRNEVLVYFHSPVEAGLEKLNESEYELPAPNDDSEIGGLEDKKISVFMRKAPYHFGWDWGPRFVTSGIWKEARVECWSSSRIDNVYIEQKIVTFNKADFIAHVTVESTEKQSLRVQLSTDGVFKEETISVGRGRTIVELPLTLLDPQLWWTHDLGDQPLYTFAVNVMDENELESHESVQTGIRSIRLVRKEDEYGQTFQFEINGIPLFIKGANHIPLDTFLSEVEDSRYIDEVDSVWKANMNMIRVWGGGIYERDILYQQCDEKGILVWQDFMFACSMYPGNAAFLENVAAELEENIIRLRNHPSLAVWCGNNEIDSMWKEYGENTSWGWGWKSQYEPHQREEVWNAYDTLFHKLIPQKLDELHPEHNYWPSSPMAELTYDGNQHASLKRHRGDIHFWNVWHSHAPIEEYNNFIGRFMSEYGFQSFPEHSTYEKLAPNHELSIEAPAVNHHQKNKSGNDLILHYLDLYYKAPANFDGYIYLSQQLQGHAFDTAIRVHRKAMPYCMGTLYWQINDSWPGASWSTIDYYGNWKAGHYSVKEAYKETILVFEETETQVLVHGISDALEDQKYTLKLHHGYFDSTSNDTYSEVLVTLPKQSSTLIYKIEKTDLLNKDNADQTYLCGQLVKDDGESIESYMYFFSKLKEVELPTPSFDCSTEVKESGILYTITSDTFAKGVYLESPVPGRFEDNHFDLIAGEERHVLFIPEAEVKEEQQSLTITSMVDYIAR